MRSVTTVNLMARDFTHASFKDLANRRIGGQAWVIGRGCVDPQKEEQIGGPTETVGRQDSAQVGVTGGRAFSGADSGSVVGVGGRVSMAIFVKAGELVISGSGGGRRYLPSSITV